MEEEVERVHVLYTGHVQGVGFRYSVLREASHWDVAGYVRNLPDGRVELEAEGPPEQIRGFLEAIRSGPLRRFIRREEERRLPASAGFDGFEIRW